MPLGGRCSPPLLRINNSETQRHIIGKPRELCDSLLSEYILGASSVPAEHFLCISSYNTSFNPPISSKKYACILVYRWENGVSLISHGNVISSTVTTGSDPVLHVWKLLRVDLKSSHKEKKKNTKLVTMFSAWEFSSREKRLVTDVN